MSHTALSPPLTLDDLTVRREEILARAARNGASNVRVFGSVARGEAGAASDLDLQIDLEAGRSLFDIAGLVVDLEDLLGREVNIARAGALRRPEVRRRILAEACPLTRGDLDLLAQIIEVAERIERSHRGRRAEFERDVIPWRQIVAQRNVVIHEYDHIALDAVWSVVERDLPTLVEGLHEILASEAEGPQ